MRMGLLLEWAIPDRFAVRREALKGLSTPRFRLGLHFYIIPRRFPERLELAFSRGARRNHLRRLLGEPSRPVGPPTTGMLDRILDPGGELAPRRAASPIFVFGLVGGVYNACDMAGARHDIAHRPAKILRADEHRFGRRDMVLARGEFIDRNRHLAEIERFAADDHAPPRQIVFEVAIAQIERMI